MPLVAAGAMAALPASAHAAAQGAGGISLDRTPSPPQAVQVGVGTQQLDWTVTFGGSPDRVVTSILAPGATAPFQLTTTPIAGLPSPQSGGLAFSPPAGAPTGRYTGRVDYIATGEVVEASASVAFDVALQLGTLVIIGFEDLDGNGVRGAGEPGLSGWSFALTNPDGNPSQAVSGSDGSVTLVDVPAGGWRVQAGVPSGWVPIAPAGRAGAAEVPAGGTAAFALGAARPAPIGGRVFRDDDRDGVQDPGEPGLGDVTLRLGGALGTGAPVSATATSAPDGTYQFAGNLPGTFEVRAAAPAGLVATSPGAGGDVVVSSGAGVSDRDIGFAPPLPVASATAGAPDVRIGKGAPRASRRGGRFSYTIVVRNRGTSVARGVRVFDRVPRQLRLTRRPRGAVPRRGVLRWTLGALKPGEKRVLRVPVRVASVSPRTIMRNTATLTAAGLSRRRATAVTRLTPGVVNAGRLWPRPGSAVTTRRPTLRWRSRPGARLYNLQLFAFRGREGRAVKILSVFPSRTSFRVPAGRLRPGERYSWRVWPFLDGGRGFARRPLGVSHFRVRRPTASALSARRLLAPRVSRLTRARPLAVRWKERKGTKSYRLEMTRGSRVVHRMTTSGTRAIVPAAAIRSKGKYSLAVRASRGASRTSFHRAPWARGTFRRA